MNVMRQFVVVVGLASLLSAVIGLGPDSLSRLHLTKTDGEQMLVEASRSDIVSVQCESRCTVAELARSFELIEVPKVLATSATIYAPEISQPESGTNRNDPVLNFERLWRIFDRRYAFFELRGVDWDQVYEHYRPQINAQTTDEELFDVLCDMLTLLRDGHVVLESDDDECDAGPEPRFYQEFDDDQIEQLLQTTRATLTGTGFGQTRNATGMLRYSWSDELGFIRIKRFYGPSKNALNNALDRVLHDLAHVDGLIVDIRDNPGGEDILAYTIAQRFACERRLGHYKITRRGPGRCNFGPRKNWFLRPGNRDTFTGPIVLLTNDASFSAADVFALAMDQIPHVTIVGDRTYGIFSDTLERELPNGWSFSLSHQKYYSPKGICYEGRGVPVDFRILNTIADLEAGEDSVVAFALNLLKKR